MSDWATVPFRKSTRSSTNGGNCVEVGFRPGLVAVRDSKSPASGLIELHITTWTKTMASFRAS
ncbi:DUF397 domain-containing protein [Actinokineospora terrae]|uniref:DUF397 domain-containing protein n=1 Tax=Actinokineospora terrae TaxID=155974 RepID=A0A1H9NQW2_9PSEU|nr:DUF397 domain-containing protein [Actinokineospora terrae]SER38291.1 protein of unknown function [Actinokineospora terrae]